MTSNGKQESFSQPSNESGGDYLSEVVRETLAEVIGVQVKQWARERALIEAEAARAIADMRHLMLELRAELTEQIALRLASLHNGEPGAPGERGETGTAGPQGTTGEKGEPGLPGLTGEAGPAGPPGPPGPAGEKGEPGDMAMIEARAGRVIAEIKTDALAIRTELADMIAMRLAHVRSGEQGPQGERGERGEPGESVRGEPGPPGPQGEKGISGEAGPEGPAGPAGEPGPAGIAGPAGEPGEPGPIGQQGPPGERGSDGATGPKGDDGRPGETGPAGAAGEPGPPGAAGEPGIPGARGAKGDPGEPGPIGQPGAPGAMGKIGPQGGQGEKGEPGERGEQGPPGKLPVVKAFAVGKVHYESDVVTCGGSLWQAMCDTVTAPPNEDWIELARAGRDAPAPIVRGTWRDTDSYSKLDIVTLDRSSFIALKDKPGVCPGADWQMLALGGKPGIKGPPGEKGQKGDRGEPGEHAPRIIGWKVDKERYTITPILSDGTQEAPLKVRELFEQFHDEAR